MSNYFAGPGNSNDGNGGIGTITGVARSVSVNITPFAGIQVEIITPAGYDRSLTFQVSHDDPTIVDASKNWVNVPYVDLATPAVGPTTGAISPGATQRKLYQILALGRFFSINQTGGTTGNAQWRIIANEDAGGLSQGFAGAAGTGGTPSLSAATTGTGTVVGFGAARQTVAMQCVATAGTTAGTIVLEGSIDGTNYVTLATYAVGADGLDAIKVSSGVPVLYARARFTVNASGGGGPAVTATICAI